MLELIQLIMDMIALGVWRHGFGTAVLVVEVPFHNIHFHGTVGLTFLLTFIRDCAIHE